MALSTSSPMATASGIPLLDSYSSSVRQAVERVNYFGPYGYQPNVGGAIVFTIVFLLCSAVLTWRGVRAKSPWLLSTLAFGAFAEAVGNILRIYGHYHPSVVNPYIGQQVVLVLTPAFFAAAHFTILTKICKALDNDNEGKVVHPFKVNWLIPFFVCLDITSLGIQGAGSGLAASAETANKSVNDINKYGYIVVAGLALQLLGYFVFDVLFVTLCLRLSRRSQSEAAKSEKKTNVLPPKELEMLLAATLISATYIFARSAFRLAEMSIGWIGRVATTEWYYLVFDATFVALSLITLIVVSPTHHLEVIRAKSSLLPTTSSSTPM